MVHRVLERGGVSAVVESRRRVSGARVGLSLIVLAGLFVRVEAGDAIELQWMKTNGRVVSVTEKVTRGFNVLESKNRRVLTAREHRWIWRAGYTEELTAKGWLRTYDKVSRQAGSGRARPKYPDPVKAAGFENHQVRLSDGDLSAKDADLDEADRRELRRVGRLARALLPEGPVAVGQSWTPEAGALAAVMPVLKDAGAGGTPKLKAKVKLVKIEEQAGRRLARLDISLDLRRKHGKLGASFWKLSGEAAFDIAGGFMASLDLKGKWQCSRGRIRVTQGRRRTYRNLHELTHKGQERLQLTAELVAAGAGPAEPKGKPDGGRDSGGEKAEGESAGDDDPKPGGAKSP